MIHNRMVHIGCKKNMEAICGSLMLIKSKTLLELANQKGQILNEDLFYE